jgi:butyryl-CoA dehydrogenase/short/branched chain acyl-CoA dehydrogenase
VKAANAIEPALAEHSPAALTRLPEGEQAFSEKVRNFAQTRIGPLVQQMDQQAEMPATLLRELFSEGLMGIEVPQKYGGRGGTFFETMLAIQELSKVDSGVSVCVHVHNALVITAMLRWATPRQRELYLPKLATDTVGAYAVSEEESGSDAFAMTTRAERVAQGFVLNGRKCWITNAAEAGLFLVFANLTPDQGPQGITVFLVERNSPGLSVGRREDKLGIRASSTCELIMKNVPVPAENVLGEIGGGGKLAVETLGTGRIGIAAQMCGLAEGAFDAAMSYARRRKQFGQAIVNFQGVHFTLAKMATDVEAARLLVYNAARLHASDASASERFRTASMAKYFSSLVAESVSSKAVEIFGGQGYVKRNPVEKFYRDAKIGAIYEGTTNIQLRTIATALLGNPQ